MRALLLTVFAMLVPVVSLAGNSVGTIDSILVFDGGMLIYVYPTGGVVNPPGCHGSNGNYFSFSMSRPLAKEYLAVLVAAQIARSRVNIWGKGTCQDQSVSETLDYFRIES